MRASDADDFSDPFKAAPLFRMNTEISFTPNEVATYYAVRVPNLKPARTGERRGPCPIHDGKDDNFAVDPETGLWSCHSVCSRGGDILALEQALTSVDFKTAKAEVFRIVGRFETSNGTNGRYTHSLIVATYDYTDESGKLVYQAVRFDPKGFKQRKPDGNGGWVWNISGLHRVLYRLPELLKRESETVFVCEGEKDVHSLEAFALLATCNAMGAGKWRPEYSETLRGRSVVILLDNDRPGREHGTTVAAALLSVAASVCIVELPGLPEKGDVTDWREAGGTLEQFHEIVKAAPRLDAAQLLKLRQQWGLVEEERYNPPRRTMAAAGSLTTRCLSDVEAKPVRWLWPGRIARGKLTIIAGNPGLGKSQITASIAAIVTKGGNWPVDREKSELGDLLFMSAEDDPADTLRPRLEAAGADLRRVHFVDGVAIGYAGDGSRTDRAFSLQADVQALSSKLLELRDVVAVVIDPISAYLGDTDSHKNADVRGLLAPLSQLAARHDIAIIGISHLTKGMGTQALMRVTGSLAFVAAARAAYLVTADGQDKTRRLFLPMKNNLGPDVNGLAFRIEGTTVTSKAGPLATSRVSWESESVQMTADEAMQAEETPRSTSALDEAMEWLRETLANGPLAASEMLHRATAEGISRKTLQRASKALGLQRTKKAMTGGWSWSLPSKVAKSAEDAHISDVTTFEEVGHLREPEDRQEQLRGETGRRQWESKP